MTTTKTTLEFIADVKAKHGITSDYAAAKLLGVSKMTLSHYRNGKGMLGDEVAMKVAELLEVDPAYVMACIHAEREKNEALKKIWKRIAESMAGVAAVFAVFAVVLAVGADTMPAHLMAPEGASGLVLAGFTLAGQSIHYAFSGMVQNWPVSLLVFAALAAAYPRHTP